MLCFDWNLASYPELSSPVIHREVYDRQETWTCMDLLMTFTRFVLGSKGKGFWY